MSFGILDKRLSQRGIKGDPKKVLVSAIGGRMFTSGSYRVHMFTSTDSFQVLYKAAGSNLTWQYFLVGGGSSGAAGGGGGGRVGGSGGGGGDGTYKSSTSASFDLFNLRNTYTITVGGAGSASTIANNSTTITSAGGVTPGGGSGGQGEQLGDPDPTECPVDVEGVAGGNGGAPVGSSIIFGGPYTTYCAGGGGGGGAGGTSGGQSGRTGPDGDGGYGGDAGTNNATAGTNALINSGDGGGGGGGGSAYCTSPPPSQPGGAAGLGGSGIVFIKYQFEE